MLTALPSAWHTEKIQKTSACVVIAANFIIIWCSLHVFTTSDLLWELGFLKFFFFFCSDDNLVRIIHTFSSTFTFTYERCKGCNCTQGLEVQLQAAKYCFPGFKDSWATTNLSIWPH